MDATRLKRIPVFSDLDDDALEQVAALAAEVSVPSGKELVREGDYSYDVLAIEDRCSHDDGNLVEVLGSPDAARG